MGYALGRLVSFGSYTFPSALQKLTDNFRDVANQVTKTIGASGGVDQYGIAAAPTAVGKVTVNFVLEASTPSGMTVLRDAVTALVNYGTQWLTMQPTDDTLGTRRCRARVDVIDMPQDFKKQTDLWQPVTLTFEVADPRWFGAGTNTALWGGVTWGAFTWGGNPTVVSISAALSGSATLTNAGNCPTELRCNIVTAAGNTASYPTIKRIVDGAVVEYVQYNGTIAASSELWIDPRQLKTYLNGANARSSLVYKTADWLTLEPGANSIELTFEVASTCTVYFYWWDAYR